MKMSQTIKPGVCRCIAYACAHACAHACAYALGMTSSMAEPSWWSHPQTKIWTGSAVNVDNDNPINAGQVKHFASMAANYLDLTAPGGSGRFGQLTDSFEQEDNYGPVTVSQLKALGEALSLRFHQIGYDPRPYWQSVGVSADIFSSQSAPFVPWGHWLVGDDPLAVVGQLKIMFSFDLGPVGNPTDTNNDGIADWWVAYHFPGGFDGNANDDSDGLTNAEEYAAGMNPFRGDSDGDGAPDEIEDLHGEGAYDAVLFTVHAAPGKLDICVDGEHILREADDPGDWPEVARQRPQVVTLFLKLGSRHTVNLFSDESGSYNVEFSEGGGTGLQNWSLDNGSSSLPTGSLSGEPFWELIPPLIDLDVDSNADGTLHRSAREDKYEYLIPAFVAVNQGRNIDSDTVPDFVDGIDSFGNGNPHACLPFGMMELEVGELLDPPSQWKVRFTYSASDPGSISRSGTSPAYEYWIPPGRLRIWDRNGDEVRKPAQIGSGGNYVHTGVSYPLSALGLSSDNRAKRLFVEGLELDVEGAPPPAKTEVTVELLQNGGVVATDTVVIKQFSRVIDNDL